MYISILFSTLGGRGYHVHKLARREPAVSEIVEPNFSDSVKSRVNLIQAALVLDVRKENQIPPSVPIDYWKLRSSCRTGKRGLCGHSPRIIGHRALMLVLQVTRGSQCLAL